MLILDRSNGEGVNVYYNNQFLGKIIVKEVRTSNRVSIGFDLPRSVMIEREEINDSIPLNPMNRKNANND